MHVWNAMLGMRALRPKGVLATTIRPLEMFAVPVHLIVTNNISLGGAFSPDLVGPTPAGLAHDLGEVPPEHWPHGPGDSLPFGVRGNLNSMIPNNWRV